MSEQIGFSIQCDTIREGWPEIIKLVRAVDSAPSNPPTKFVLGLTVVVNKPLEGMIPSYVPGAPIWTSVEALDGYASQLLDGHKRGFEYTYGERLRAYQGNVDQLQYIINTIKKDRYSRRAVATLREIKDMGRVDTPCMINVQALFDGRLNLFAHFRSHDIKAWPVNCYGLAKLLAYVCNKTLLYPGRLCVMSSNLHGYQEDGGWMEKI